MRLTAAASGNHLGARHIEDRSGCVYKSNVHALAHKGDRSSLYDRYPQMVREKTHHSGVLHPRETLQFGAPFGQRNREDVAVHVFAEDAKQLCMRQMTCARNLNGMLIWDDESCIVQQEAAGFNQCCNGGASDEHEHADRGDPAPECLREKAIAEIDAHTTPFTWNDLGLILGVVVGAITAQGHLRDKRGALEASSSEAFCGARGLRRIQHRRATVRKKIARSHACRKSPERFLTR